MHSLVRPILAALAIYFALSYYFDEPDTLVSDVEQIHELTDPASATRDRAEDGVMAAENEGSETIFQAKSRIDGVKGRVEDSIALGAERFAGER